MDTLGALEIFLQVAERLSFADAARRLGLSPSAVGKAIARLEDRLAVPLFHRTTRRVSLTDEGQLLYERALRLREEVSDLTAAMAQTSAAPQGRLRVSLPAIGYRFLAPHLADFARRFPAVRLDLDFSDATIDLAAEGVDLAIRGGELSDSGLMARKLSSFRFIFCAAPAYLEARAEPKSLAALAEQAVLRYRRPGSEALQGWTTRTPPPSDAALGPPAIICTNMEAVLAATIAGLGIASMPDFLAAAALRRGELREILPDEAAEGVFRLVWAGGRAVSPKLRAFLDFASERLFK